MKQNRKFLIGSVIAILVVILLVFVLRGMFSKDAVIRSDDGQVELIIPNRALPESLSVSDISVTKVDSADYFGNEQNGDSIAVYSLEPDGLTLSEKVLLTFKLPLIEESEDSYALPLFIHDSGEPGSDSEILDIAGIEIDEDEGAMFVATTIDHFSHVTRDFSGLFTFRYSPSRASRFLLYQSFDLVLELKTQSKKYVYDVVGKPGETVEVLHSVAEGSTLNVNYSPADETVFHWRQPIIRSERGYLEPRKVTLEPAKGTAEKGYSFTQKYTCENRDWDNLHLDPWSVDFTWERKTTRIPGGVPEVYRAKKRAVINTPLLDYECYAVRDADGNLLTPPDSTPEGGFVCAGPPYTVLCRDGRSLSGAVMTDKNCKPLYDAAGNPFDAKTGMVVLCE